MNRSLKRMTITLLAGALSIVGAGCGAKTDLATSNEGEVSKTETTKEVKTEEPKKEETAKGVSVSYVIPNSWANYGPTKEIIAEWESKTGNKIDVQAIPDEKYDSVVATRLAAGDGIDIFFGANKMFDVPNLLLEIEGEAFESRLNPVALESLRHTDGKIYGFPKAEGLGSYGIFYNKDVFEKAGIEELPTTFDQFNEMCEKIKMAGVTPIYLSGKDGWTLLQHRNAVNGTLTLGDKEIWDKLNKNEIEWKDIPEFVDQYEQLAIWAEKGYINELFLTTSYEEAQKALADGSAGMLIQGTWVVGEVLKQNPDANLGFLAMPTKSGEQMIGLSGFDGGAHIAKASKVQEEAKDFLRFFSEKEQVTKYLLGSPGISAYNDVDISDVLPEALKEVQAYVKAGKTGPHGDSVYVVPSPGDTIIAYYQELLSGRVTPEDFVTQHGAAFVGNAKTAGIAGF